jgi:two-component system, NtrC family, sensor kinase
MPEKGDQRDPGASGHGDLGGPIRAPRPPLARSLSLRLFLWLVAVMAIVFGLHTRHAVRTTARHWQALVCSDARIASEVIQRSTRHAMLRNSKEDVGEIIHALARMPGVVGIRIYDKQGRIVVSGDSTEVGRAVDMQAEACVICHERSEPLHAVSSATLHRIYRAPNGERVLGLINPIPNEPQCQSCHVHRGDQTILGVLDVKMSLAAADSQLAAANRRVVWDALVMAVILGAVSAAFIYWMVRVPVRRLIAGARRIAAGELDTRVDIDSQDEVGELAQAFNQMSENLGRARAEITEWANTLEAKVIEKTDDLGRAQRQLLHMEKMASLGKLSATVAHELNNPLAGILSYARLVERELGRGDRSLAERDELIGYLSLVRQEAARCGQIVQSLLIFAKGSAPRMAEHHVHDIVERCLMLVRHQVERAGIQVEWQPLSGDDTLTCDGDRIQQALLALLVNAVEAMPDGGVLRLCVDERPPLHPNGPRSMAVVIADTGPGIPPAVLPHIFEPFFTTKEEGRGLGLGLSVAYGIVEQHLGQIHVESSGAGTTFTIVLPREQATRTGPVVPPAPAAAAQVPEAASAAVKVMSP